jgi:putative endonuclease
VYIFTTFKNSVLYTGITNDLIRRAYEHRHNLVKGFTKRYNVHKLVYYDSVEDVISAIEREKQIKSWVRKKKIELIYKFNPDWRDLYDDISG